MIIRILSIAFAVFQLNGLYAQHEKFIALHERPKGMYHTQKIWNPQWFQGHARKQSYFEGWYFKFVSTDGATRYAFIPGISVGKDSHAFVQVINGNTGQTAYHRFEADAFRYSTERFAVYIGNNFFSADSLSVDLGSDQARIRAHLQHTGLNTYPVRLAAPGIMGWYRYVPRMECFHGVVSIDHQVNGNLILAADSVISFAGKGYIEKDWGRSMPSAWVWTQSNSFAGAADASFMMSVANIPWLGNSFTGFLGYLYANGKLYRFATYTGAKLKLLQTEGDQVRVVIKERKFTIEFQGLKGTRGDLLAPVAGDMARTIHESIDAKIQVRLLDRSGKLLFEGQADIAGLEIVGTLDQIEPKVKK